MFSSAEHQLLYRVANAPILQFPYPHIYVTDVFPAEFYRRLRESLPPRDKLKSLKDMGRVNEHYPDTRWALPLTPDDVESLPPPYRDFWYETAGWLLGGRFAQLVLSKFGAFIEQRFPDAHSREFRAEALVVQDETNYELKPHTDAPHKVLSFLFYLPESDALRHLGTSIYLPKDPSFTCPGGPYYESAGFDRLMTMPYVPNALFAFLKTPQSFHGVERVSEQNVRRDLLLVDIKTKVAPPPAQQPAPPGAPPSVKFSF